MDFKCDLDFQVLTATSHRGFLDLEKAKRISLIGQEFLLNQIWVKKKNTMENQHQTIQAWFFFFSDSIVR